MKLWAVSVSLLPVQIRNYRHYFWSRENNEGFLLLLSFSLIGFVKLTSAA